MREILFRGKRVDNGDWIYDSEAYILDGDGVWLSDEDRHVVRVIPETLGQYTGLVSKNGRKIYEGDIVKCTSKNTTGYCVVVFEDGEFILVFCEIYKSRKNEWTYPPLRRFDKTVIGNIHDNPELLEVEK